MPTLANLLARAALDPPDGEWLHLLVGDWQLLSDLSFADLVLWVQTPAPTREGAAPEQWLAVAHCRPSTGATAIHDDIVGRPPSSTVRPLIETAWAEGGPVRERTPHLDDDDIASRLEAVAVVCRGRRIGVMSRHTNLATPRSRGRLELTYLQCADDLVRMVGAGDFPSLAAPGGARRGAPRVGDGLFRLDAEGRIGYASPNAASALHRLGFTGDLIGTALAEVVAPLLDSSAPVDESLPLVLAGRAPWRADVETRGTAMSLRAIPLMRDGRRDAALVLVRDVSELRRRERELVSKDATIREVHHRVKNNLQTVAALLRLQARRLESPEGRDALEEAMRRVSTIAMVHEELSSGFGESVDFDQVVDRTVMLAAPLAGTRGGAAVRRVGGFGELDAATATPLALVLTELVTNAVEHGLAGDGEGAITITGLREGSTLRAVVRDDGAGLPQGFRPGATGLGTQIVQALVAGDLHGRINWHSPAGGGTEVVIDMVLPERRGQSPAPRPARGAPSGRGAL